MGRLVAGIKAYVGYNGDGKTLGAMLFEVRSAMRKHQLIYSTVPIPSYEGYRPLESWRQIWHMENALLLLDDISSHLPARGSASVPTALVSRIDSMRHYRMAVVWTAPSWKGADVALRRVTQQVTFCKGMMPDRWERMAWTEGHAPKLLTGRRLRNVSGKPVGSDPLWRPNRLFRFRTYDGARISEDTGLPMRETKALRKTWYWRPWHTEQRLYDTLAPIGLLDNVDESGSCLMCGGHKTRRKCTCPETAGGLVFEPASPVPEWFGERVVL